MMQKIESKCKKKSTGKSGYWHHNEEAVRYDDHCQVTYAAIDDDSRLLHSLIAWHGQKEYLVRPLLVEWAVLFIAHHH